MAADNPPGKGRESELLGWLKEQITDSRRFLKAQVGYEKIQACIEAVNGDKYEIKPKDLSKTSTNRIGLIERSLVSNLTDVKPFWEYKTNSRKNEQHAVNFGKLSIHWYLGSFADLRFADGIHYYTVGGTGWPTQVYDPRANDIVLKSHDPRNVLPIRPRDLISIQNAAGVIIEEEVPTAWLKAEYPRKASQIESDRQASFPERVKAALGPFWRNVMGTSDSGKPEELVGVAVTRKYTVYLDDTSRNEGTMPVAVGQFDKDGKPSNNWSYLVQPGELLYPRKRYIVCTETAVLHDGPSIYWHGIYPPCKMTLDPLPWSWLGHAPLWDLLPLQDSLNRRLRMVDDHCEKAVRPDLIVDGNLISRAEKEAMTDTRKAGLNLRYKSLSGRGGVELKYPPPLDAAIPASIQWLTDEMDILSGNRDLSQMMRLNQMPSPDSIEKITESMSSLGKLRSRCLEAFMREFATQLAYNFAQFYTLPMRLSILGTQGVTKEDFDFDPGTLIPDFPFASDYDDKGRLTYQAIQAGPRPRYERAREHMKQFSFHVAPGSLLSGSRIERQLKYLQLARAGLIDMWTLLEELDVPNVGSPPDGANTITERLAAQSQLGVGMNVSPVGRKASGQSMPRLTVKES